MIQESKETGIIENCKSGKIKHQEIFYLWRPFLKDPMDDMILELAVVSGSDFIITHNTGDFEGSKRFGVDVLTPREFLGKIGGL